MDRKITAACNSTNGTFVSGTLQDESGAVNTGVFLVDRGGVLRTVLQCPQSPDAMDFQSGHLLVLVMRDEQRVMQLLEYPSLKEVFTCVTTDDSATCALLHTAAGGVPDVAIGTTGGAVSFVIGQEVQEPCTVGSCVLCVRETESGCFAITDRGVFITSPGESSSLLKVEWGTPVSSGCISLSNDGPCVCWGMGSSSLVAWHSGLSTPLALPLPVIDGSAQELVCLSSSMNGDGSCLVCAKTSDLCLRVVRISLRESQLNATLIGDCVGIAADARLRAILSIPEGGHCVATIDSIVPVVVAVVPRRQDRKESLPQAPGLNKAKKSVASLQPLRADENVKALSVKPTIVLTTAQVDEGKETVTKTEKRESEKQTVITAKEKRKVIPSDRAPPVEVQQASSSRQPTPAVGVIRKSKATSPTPNSANTLLPLPTSKTPLPDVPSTKVLQGKKLPGVDVVTTTDDLELLRESMHIYIFTRLLGENKEQDPLFVPFPTHFRAQEAVARLESFYQKRLVVSFATPSGKLVELRPSTIKIFESFSDSEKQIYCRTLYQPLAVLDGVSKRAATPSVAAPALLLSRAATPGAATAPPEQRITPAHESAMIWRLYKTATTSHKEKIERLEQEVFPTQQPKVLPRQQTALLVERLFGDAAQIQKKVEQMREKTEATARGDRLPPVLTEEELKQRIHYFYDETLQRQREKEAKIEEGRFKPRTYKKISTKEEWDEWQQSMARPIGLKLRLKNQFF